MINSDFDMTAVNKYTDTTINIYDNKIYHGNPEEKKVSHQGELRFVKAYECNYCMLHFQSRSKLFRHLGYCNVDIIPKLCKRKLKQLKITQYLKGSQKCISYNADNEMDLETDNFCRPAKKVKVTISKSNNDSAIDMDVLTIMLDNLSTRNRPRYNLRSQIKNKNQKSDKFETRKRKANSKSMKKDKPSKKKKIDIEDLLADLEI